MNYQKLHDELFEWVITLFMIGGIALMGFGLGELLTTSDYTEHISNKYGLNMTITNMDKLDAVYHVLYLDRNILDGVSHMLTGYILVLIGAILGITFNKPKKRKRTKTTTPKQRREWYKKHRTKPPNHAS